MPVGRLVAVVGLVVITGAVLFWPERAVDDECTDPRAHWSLLGTEAQKAEVDLNSARAYLERPYSTAVWRERLSDLRDRSERMLVELQLQASAVMSEHPDCFTPVEMIGGA